MGITVAGSLPSSSGDAPVVTQTALSRPAQTSYYWSYLENITNSLSLLWESTLAPSAYFRSPGLPPQDHKTNGFYNSEGQGMVHPTLCAGLSPPPNWQL